jgi:GDP/UDP-N,N'-diacetylbacillosamine 2-epimerase (hydrolysing)
MTRKILSITGTRADYGLMRPVHEAIHQDADLDLFLVVTGMHYLPEFNHSLEELRREKLGTLVELPVADHSSTSASMAATLGAHVQALVPVIEGIKPDIMLLQGDRGEMLAGAIVAAHMNIPIVHMSGGDRSGTIDDSLRHAITKLAHIHLPTCEDSRQNLLSMGEEAGRIRVVGEPALDIITTFTPLSKADLERIYPALNGSRPFVIVAQHPVTNEVHAAGEQMQMTLEAILELGLQAVLTAPNSDAGSGLISEKINFFTEKYPETFIFVAHLGQENFYSLMHYAAALIGNSSAGILEAASFKLPVVNIGTRQHSRLRAENVLDVHYSKDEICKALETCRSDKKFKENVSCCVNPYGQGDTAKQTVEVLRTLKLQPDLISKWIKGFAPL